MAASHSSSHAFHLINDTHFLKIATFTTYSRDVESTHDLINENYFQICLNIFDYYNTRAVSIDIFRIIFKS
jgi:hypothetical protein